MDGIPEAVKPFLTYGSFGVLVLLIGVIVFGGYRVINAVATSFVTTLKEMTLDLKSLREAVLAESYRVRHDLRADVTAAKHDLQNTIRDARNDLLQEIRDLEVEPTHPGIGPDPPQQLPPRRQRFDAPRVVDPRQEQDEVLSTPPPRRTPRLPR